MKKRVKEHKIIISLAIAFIAILSFCIPFNSISKVQAMKICTDVCCEKQRQTLADTQNASEDIMLLAYNDTTCSSCNGTGVGKEDCETCDGKGWWIRVDEHNYGSNHLVVYVLFGCEDCGGRGSDADYSTSALDHSLVTYGTGLAECSVCDGDGKVSSPDIYITATAGGDQTILQWDKATVSVTAEVKYATSNMPLSYQWHVSNNADFTPTAETQMSGETSSECDLSSLKVGTHYLKAVVSSSGLTDRTSTALKVTVNPAPVRLRIKEDLQNVTVTEGKNTIFSVIAEAIYSDDSVSTSELKYQWYQNGTALPGETGSTLTIGDSEEVGVTLIYVTISADGFEDIKSSNVVLTVTPAVTDLQIIKDIQNAVIMEGELATFAITAQKMLSDGSTNSNDISYQWYLDGVAIEGGNESSLTIGNQLEKGEYLIYAKATYGDFIATSSTVSLSVTSRTFIDITYAFGDTSITEYSSKTLQVIATAIDTEGNPHNFPITYQWFVDGKELEGETKSSLSFKGELKTQMNSDGVEEKISPSDYFVQVKLSCEECADVEASGTITVEKSEASLVICNTCLGAGEIPCHNVCGPYHGVTCVNCDGLGFDNTIYYHAPCNLCGNDGFIECYLCEGDGMMDCPDCGPEPPSVNNNIKDEDPDAWYVEAIKELCLSITIYTAGLIDLLINLFKKLVGLENVHIGGKDGNLLMYFLEDNSTQAVLIGTMAIGLVLLFLFAIIGFIRAMHVSDEKVNAGSVFEKFILSGMNIILVPSILVLLIFCSNVVMGQINVALEEGLVYSTEDVNDNMQISYGGQMLMLLAENEYDKAKIFDMTVEDTVWSDVAKQLYEKDEETLNKFFPDGQISDSAIFGGNSILFTQGRSFPNFAYMEIENWTNKKDGAYYIPTSRLNVFIALAGCIAMLVTLILCSFTFVKRIFDVMLLYIVSPLMISTTPIDDGTRFKQWRDLMISKVISAYAIVLTVNLYFMIVPKILINPGVIFDTNNSIANGIIQLLFVIGGAFALNGANLVFSQLLGTGNMEHQQNVGMQMALMNMARVGAGVVSGTSAYAARTVIQTAKHGAGITFGGMSSAVKGGTSGGFSGIVSNFGKGSSGYVKSTVASSRLGETMKDWMNHTQSGSNTTKP